MLNGLLEYDGVNESPFHHIAAGEGIQTGSSLAVFFFLRALRYFGRPYLDLRFCNVHCVK